MTTIKIKAYPCGRKRQLTKEYIKEVIPTEYGSIIKSYIESRDKVFYHEIFNSKEEVEKMIKGE